jgi:multidrug resistance protein MdtO
MSGAADSVIPRSELPPRRISTFLRESLQPFPGRAEASLRMTLACLVIITISMTLQIPSTALAAYMVFFVSREDMATTAKTGIALILAVTIAIGLTILCFQFTVNQPALRLALMAVLFALGMYISRIFALGALGFGLGFVLLITQSTVDLYPSGELLLRDTLWIWAALSFSITVVILVNVLVLPARPLALLREEVIYRLRFVADNLVVHQAAPASAPGSASGPASAASPAPAPALPAGAMRALDPVRPFALMKLAAGKAPDFARKIPAYSAAIAALSKLIEATCILSSQPATPSPSQAARLQNLRDSCIAMMHTIAHPGPSAYVPAPSTSPSGTGTADALLAEMEAGMADIATHWNAAHRGDEMAAPPPVAKPSLFVPDARTNPIYQQFALKVTFAAMFCYVLYTGFAWPGIHTCTITCAVIALTTSGSTVHKATMRMLGALAGGALALFATVFIVPHLESLGGLLLLITPVALASAWISVGGERIAYFGWQLAFAFFLCILHGFEPSTDVTIVRDRLIGVLIGTAVMGLIFHYVWPERASDQLRHTLARILRSTGQRSVLQDLRTASRQAQDAAFEIGLGQSARVDGLFASTQAVVLASLAPHRLPIDATLHHYADYLEGAQPPGTVPPPAPVATSDSPQEQALLARLEWLRQSCIAYRS